MNFNVRSIAALKYKETQYPEVDWVKALESARQSLKFIEIDYQSLELIAMACRSPAQFTVITRLIYQYGKSHPHGALISELILKNVNDSPFSLSDWIAAIEYFYQWLETNHRKTDFLPMLKYLECCVVSPEAKEGGQTLTSLVGDMLRVIGYEG